MAQGCLTLSLLLGCCVHSHFSISLVMISPNCVGKSSKIGCCDQNVRKHEVKTSKGQFRGESMAFRCRWLQSSALKQRRNLYLGTFMQSITARCSSEVPKQLEITKSKQSKKTSKGQKKKKKRKKIIQLMNVMSFRKRNTLFFLFPTEISYQSLNQGCHG